MDPSSLDAGLVQQRLVGSAETAGVFERLLGFRTGTGAIKGVHLMNDLAQTVTLSLPEHGGDLLCRVIRQHHEKASAEGNADSQLRADAELGVAYSTAYPEQLGAQLVSELRSAAGLLLNADGGIYEPGKNMASSLATHVGLLGRDGFRRFKVGPYIASLMGEDGTARLRELFMQETDPVTRALRPLYANSRLTTIERTEYSYDPTPFDLVLGRRLATLLSQPLSKPTLLRFFALASSLCVLLKVFGVGRGGKPALLGLSANATPSELRSLRKQAVQSLLRGRDALDRAIAAELEAEEDFDMICGEAGDEAIKPASNSNRFQRAGEIVEAMRDRRVDKKSGETEVYWPDRFALALGRKAGFILPKDTRAGWGQYLSLTQECVEILILMFVGPGDGPLSWRSFWRRVREELGIVVGADATADSHLLESGDVMHTDYEALAANAEGLLTASERRGIAVRLPDSGAEVGGRWA